jgi:hypothetical protein
MLCDDVVAAVEDNPRASSESGRAPLERTLQPCDGTLLLSKRLANSQAERVTVPALGDVGSKVDVVFLI